MNGTFPDRLPSLLVLGITGMMGHRLAWELRDRFSIYGTTRGDAGEYRNHPMLRHVELLGGISAENTGSVAEALRQSDAKHVVNCIGIVKQREEAKEAIPSIQINALFPHQLAELCETDGARLIHLSTDCVFSGRRGDYAEADLPDPVDLYGRTKLVGELDRPGCLTLRTSIIGWEIKHRAGLLEWFAAQRGKTIRGFRGAIYTGLSTSAMSRLIGSLFEDHKALYGVYQVASRPISKYELLLRLRDRLGWDDVIIEPDDDFECDRSLNSNRFEQKTGWTAPSWGEMLTQLARSRSMYDQNQDIK